MPSAPSNGGSINGAGAGSGGGGATSASGTSAGGIGMGSSSLFARPPKCEPDRWMLQGTALDAPVSYDAGLGSTSLSQYSFYTVELGSKSRLMLNWSAQLEANVALPFRAGGYFRTFWDEADPDTLYCIDEGEIGLIPEGAQDKHLKFSITKARSGEVGTTSFGANATCDGPEVQVALDGCVFRFAN